MLDLTLFLGITLTPPLEKQLSKISPPLLEHLTKGGDYLTKIGCENAFYLGKFCSPLITTDALELLEANVKSLLNKLFNQPFSPMLIPIDEPSRT